MTSESSFNMKHNSPVMSDPMDMMEQEPIESEELDSPIDTSPRSYTKATMPAAEALEKIRQGEPIKNVRIEGLKLKGKFTLPVRMRGVTLVGLVVDNAAFADEVQFEHCTLEQPRFGRASEFAKGLSFATSTLTRPQFRGITVQGSFRCDNTNFRGKLRIEKVRFEWVRFWEAQFHGWVQFDDCEFLQEADFRSFHAEEGFVFDRCHFHADVLFRGAMVHKKWQADRTRFDGLLDLSKAKLHDFVYLEAIEQGERQRFAFSNMVAERVLVRPEQIEGRLASEESGNHAQAMHEYAFLKRVYGELHRYDQEDWAFYRFKISQRRCRERSWRRPWTKVAHFADWVLLDHGCGYGTNPTRAVRAALIIMFFFALIYMAGIDLFVVDPANMPFAGEKTDFANRTMIATLTSVSAFISGFGDIRLAAKGWMNIPLIIESLLGTLLWGLFIVAFSRKVIR